MVVCATIYLSDVPLSVLTQPGCTVVKHSLSCVKRRTDAVCVSLYEGDPTSLFYIFWDVGS